MRYSDVIWDFDGTLYDTYPAFTRAMAYMLKGRGIAQDEGLIYEKMKVSISYAEDFFAQRHGLTRVESREFRRFYQQAGMDEAPLFCGAAETVRALYKAGVRQHIYTHRDHTACEFLSRSGLLGCFSGLITQECGFPGKPQPQALLWLLDCFGAQPCRALMVGDREIDILAGQGAAAHGCFFDEGGKTCAAARYQITRIDQVMKIAL